MKRVIVLMAVLCLLTGVAACSPRQMVIKEAVGMLNVMARKRARIYLDAADIFFP